MFVKKFIKGFLLIFLSSSMVICVGLTTESKMGTLIKSFTMKKVLNAAIIEATIKNQNANCFIGYLDSLNITPQN